MILSVPVSAAQSYQTYTYSIDGKVLYSPDAYTPQKNVNSTTMNLGDLSMKGPKDIVVDKEQNVFVADSGNNRILCLDRYYNLRYVIKDFVNDKGVADKLDNPQGLFVNEEHIYVCDYNAARIVRFNLADGSFHSIIDAPQSELFGDNSNYFPTAMAVDQYGRMFIVSKETNEGIIVMTQKGEFTGFIGAQKSVTSVWDQIWRRFQSKEQRKNSDAVISYPYNNIDINERGFVYATIYEPKLVSSMASAITNKDTAGTYAPCKLLNPAGDEIMRRNGFWPPAGEIDFNNKYVAGGQGKPSRIVDVACGPEQTWSIVDVDRSRVYTYDYDGNLLFAFGDIGDQLGNITNGAISAVAYQGDRLLLLDGSENPKIVVYNRTEYGDVLISALRYQNERQYDKAIDTWKEILMRNSNYDAAYIGIGDSLARSGKFEESLQYYQSAYDTENYSVAYKEMRKEWMSKFFLLIPVVIILVCFLVSKFLKYVAKVNKRAAVSGGKRTFKEELLFVFHLMFHPFDGFWDLKHEKRGSVRAALVFMGLAVIAMFYRSVGAGYVLNPQGEYTTIMMQLLVVLVPVLLFAIANWCLTTLFEGEGSFRDIFVAIGYSLPPLVITIIPTTFFSNYIVAEEADLLSLIVVIGFIWAGFLIFFGTMVTHDYTMGKNVITVIGTIGGMAFIMFLGLLFTSLIMDIVTFITNYVSEIVYRL